MLLLACVLGSLVLALAIGGRLSAFALLKLRASWAIVVSLFIQVIVISVIPDWDAPVHVPLHLLSYGLAGYCVIVNLRIPGIALIGLGGLLNFLAIAANDGIMPASSSAIAAAGLDAPGGFVNSGVVKSANLAFLGDVFAFGGPFANVFSIGDVLLGLGAAWLILSVSLKGAKEHSTRGADVSSSTESAA